VRVDNAVRFVDFRRSLVSRIAAANIAAGIYVLVYLSLIAPPPRRGSRAAVDVYSALSFVLVAGVFGLIGFRQLRRRFDPEWAWLDQSGTPTLEERRRVLRQPARMTAMLLYLWLAASVPVSIGTGIASRDARFTVAVFASTVFGALTTAALSFLLVEYSMRPLMTYALADGTPDPSATIGLRPRLILAWALGSGIPLLGVLLTPAFYHRGVVPVTAATGFVAVLGIVVGVRITVFEARSLAEPMMQLRVAQGRVQAGELDTAVTVNDGGEIGLVQHGFNEMVTGLRERQRLQDLFGRFVGEEVARAALSRGVSLGGELHQASVLFVDLVGSTGLAQRLEPTAVVALLNRVFAVVVDAITAERGWVNKFEGDGALCIFGPPAELDDHAGAALRSACRVHAQLASITIDGGQHVDAGIGVASGQVVAGNVGAEQRYEYTVIGDPVNEAARLTELAKTYPGRVLANEAAVRSARDGSRSWKLVDHVLLRGRDKPSAVYAPEAVVSERPCQPP
jgi:adenylate cyclase